MSAQRQDQNTSRGMKGRKREVPTPQRQENTQSTKSPQHKKEIIPKDRWVPKTKLGRLVLSGHITNIEEIYQQSLSIKEPELINILLGQTLKEEIMKIKPVQKQTRAGQRTRFKAVVAVGDYSGHVGLGIHTSSEVANAIQGATIYAKLSIIPVRRGYWGNKIGNPHTTPSTVTGKCGSIRMRLIPAPRGSGIVAGSVAKKLLAMAGFEDVFTSCIGHTKTTANFLVATFNAMKLTYSTQAPEQWPQRPIPEHPFSAESAFLASNHEPNKAFSNNRK